MGLRFVRRVSADLLKCGENRIYISSDPAHEEALARVDQVAELALRGLGAGELLLVVREARRELRQALAAQRVDERPDKNYATQVYYSMSIGATRLEEDKVVEIACVES